MRSSGVDLLQLIDLILGAVVYEYKANSGIVQLAQYKPKAQLLDHLKRETGVKTFTKDYRDSKLNIKQFALQAPRSKSKKKVAAATSPVEK
jgi:hypothetical protein